MIIITIFVFFLFYSIFGAQVCLFTLNFTKMINFVHYCFRICRTRFNMVFLLNQFERKSPYSFAVLNWGLPLAAFLDTTDTPERISGRMTTGKNNDSW